MPARVLESCAWKGVGIDPAIGSAGVSTTQARFEGSDRQARGRLLRSLTRGAVPSAAVAEVAGLPADPERAMRLLQSLIADGLVVALGEDGYALPG